MNQSVKTGFLESLLLLMNFRICYPKIWYVGMLKLKGFEKNSRSRKVTLTSSVSLSPDPSCLSSLKHKTFLWEVSSLYVEEGVILSSENSEWDTKKSPSKQASLTCPQFTTLSSHSLPYHIAPQLPTPHQTQHKMLRFNCSFESSFPCDGFYVM